jgi:2-dehydro-3-deoxygalactonokinase
MFSVRSFHLVGQLPAEDQAEYLSGLLIGHEIQGVQRWIESKGFSRKCLPQIRLSGGSSLCMRYHRALALSGIDGAVSASNTSAIGLWQVAIQAGLIPTLDASKFERGVAESC